MTYDELKTTPLDVLAIMALDFSRSISYRLAPYHAIRSRIAEFNGGGWILLSPIERDRISCALALDISEMFAESKSAAIAV